MRLQQKTIPCEAAYSQGFTLVEVLVAGLLILVMIMGATAAIRHGERVSALDYQRAQVRQILVNELEKVEYTHLHYSSMSTFSSSSTQSLGNVSNLQVRLYSQVDGETTVDLGLPTGVPYKRIVVSGAWNSLDGYDSMVVEKWICHILL